MLSLNPKSTALVLIDLQKGIMGRPVAPHSAAQVIDNSARLGASLSHAGGVVAPVHVAFSPDGADRLRQEVDQPNPMAALPADWSELVPEIAALRADFVIVKRQWGALSRDGARSPVAPARRRHDRPDRRRHQFRRRIDRARSLAARLLASSSPRTR